MGNLRNIIPTVRNFLLGIVNKKFLIFLFFLALSGIFWLLMTLNESYEKEFSIPVKIVNVPQNIVLTSYDTDTIKVTLHGKGIVLLEYMYGDGLKQIYIDFKSYARSNDNAVISSSEVQRFLYQQLNTSTKITSAKPDKLEYSFNYGLRKRVPVRWRGRVLPEHLYFISSVKYSPDSVDVFASKEKLDSINVIYTEMLNYANFHDTLSVLCELQKMKGVKIVPNEVKLMFYTDVLTEESIEDIPIIGINVPQGKVIRTFPAKVTVNFVTGVSLFRKLKASDFRVVVDYNEIVKHPADKCDIYLHTVPQGISRAKLAVKQVDYLIEEEKQS